MANWKNIPGWEPRYEVSDAGQVRSLDMQVPARGGKVSKRKGRLLRLIPKGGRYLCVTLSLGDRRQQYLVHDLVTLAFIGPKPAGYEVRHLNDVKLNNTLSNLAYGTKQENEADRQRNARVRKGADHGCAKLTEAQVRILRSSALSPKTLAASFNVTAAHVHAVRTYRVWKHI